MGVQPDSRPATGHPSPFSPPVAPPVGRILLMAMLFMGMAPPKPRLEVTISPRLSVPPVVLTVHARIVGDLDEEFSCPKVVWIKPDDTQSSEESDCELIDPPVSWTRRFNAVVPGVYAITVELRKPGRLIARKTVLAEVQ